MSDCHATPSASKGLWARRLVGAGAAASLLVGLLAPVAHGEALGDLREAVNANQQNQSAARQDISESQLNVSAATQRLLDSQNQLTAAQAALSDLQTELGLARAEDARLADELAAARAELEQAKRRVAQATAEVEAQLALIGHAARESFQQQTDLRGLGIVFGSESPAELSQRLQWNTTIFDTQAAEKTRLDAALVELEEARKAQAALERQVADEKADAERGVARVAALEARATAQRSTVQGLVQRNQEARSAAEGDLQADEASFRQLQSDESRLQGQIEAEIARIRAEEEAARVRAAEEAARQRAAAEEAARQRAAAEAAGRQRAAAEARARENAARASAEREASKASASRGSDARPAAPVNVARPPAGPSVSAYGFTRPVAAPYGSAFGLRFHPILKYWRAHNGVDMGAPTGTPVYAAADGVVMQSGPNGGFGNFVLLGHGNQIGGKYVTTGYAHNSRIVVRAGQQVSRGQLIAYVGSTGLSTAPHLHFELRLNGSPVNPTLYVP